ncbi:hypothetical protein U9M48_026369 [Paspalum notatum var. saurae]|uniref:Reverse transcriptase zinc-binding domain-containing protein n=1 Tax=Paspalum notatum var. saurae TaxID=547442 RepID=A0AAQ3WYR1_PASNO
MAAKKLVETVHEGMNDIAAWHFDKHGLFSVKSVYKIHQDDTKRRSTRGDPSSAAHDEEKALVWKKLWKERWPRKVTHFLWRLAHNSLALRMNLNRRGMDIDTKCVTCERLDEHGAHLFFKCKQELNLEQVRLELADKDSAMEIIRDLVKLNEDAQVKVAVLMYFWWNERCRRKEGEPRKNAQTIAHSVRIYAEEIKKQTMTQPNIKGAGQQCWKRPPENMLEAELRWSLSKQVEGKLSTPKIYSSQ